MIQVLPKRLANKFGLWCVDLFVRLCDTNLLFEVGFSIVFLRQAFGKMATLVDLHILSKSSNSA
jgi:hypothetical protein